MNHIFSLINETDIMDICILIFSKPSSLPNLYGPPTCPSILFIDRPPHSVGYIKMHHLENPERPSETYVLA